MKSILRKSPSQGVINSTVLYKLFPKYLIASIINKTDIIKI